MKISFMPVKLNAGYNKSLTKQQSTKNEQTTQPTFADSRGVYGKAIVFGNINHVKIDDFEKIKSAVQDFVQNECKPFIEETKSFYDKNNQIYEAADKTTNNFFKKVICGKTNFDIFELESVKEGFARPIQYYKNVQEFQYLKAKSKNCFSNKNAKEYVGEIAHLFVQNEPFRQSRVVLNVLKGTEKSIKNGFAGLNTKEKASEIFLKRNKVKEAERLSRSNRYYIDIVSSFMEVAEPALTKADDEYFMTKIVKYHGQIPEARAAIKEHRELLNELTEQLQTAEKLLEENNFSNEDLDKALHAVDLKKQGIINRNMRGFNEALINQPAYRWDNSKNAEADALLAKQNEANGKLWNMIEESKKKFFRPRTEEEKEAQYIREKIESANWKKEMESHGVTNFDDLPF